MKYDFNKVINRYGTNCLKYDFAVERGKPADILPLWVADMDFETANEIKETLIKVSNHGIYGYTDTKSAYFDAVSQWMKKYHNWIIKEDWLVKTPGVVYAIAMAIRSLTKEGEGVMIQSPVYYPFSSVIKDNNRILIDNTLVEHDGYYEIDYEDFEKKIVDGNVKLFILCNPQNPVGRVWSKDELQRMGEICLRHKVYVLSDEIHSDFVYEGYKHTVFSNINSQLANISIICTSPSKTFNIAGLQASNIFIENNKIRNLLQKEIDKTGYSQLNLMGLAACEAAYLYGRDWLDQVLDYIGDNLKFAEKYIMDNMPEIKLIKPQGTYFLWLDCRKLGLSNRELENLMVHKAGLWLDEGYIFGRSGSGFERINIACPRSVLSKALDSLKNSINTNKRSI